MSIASAPKALIPVVFAASLGAPVLYAGSALVSQLLGTRPVDLLLLLLMFVSAWFFSFVLTFGLFFLVVIVAKVLGKRQINTSWLPLGLVGGVMLVVAIRYDIWAGAIFGVLAFVNAVIFILLERRLP